MFVLQMALSERPNRYVRITPLLKYCSIFNSIDRAFISHSESTFHEMGSSSLVSQNGPAVVTYSVEMVTDSVE